MARAVFVQVNSHGELAVIVVECFIDSEGPAVAEFDNKVPGKCVAKTCITRPSVSADLFYIRIGDSKPLVKNNIVHLYFRWCNRNPFPRLCEEIKEYARRRKEHRPEPKGVERRGQVAEQPEIKHIRRRRGE